MVAAAISRLAGPLLKRASTTLAKHGPKLVKSLKDGLKSLLDNADQIPVADLAGEVAKKRATTSAAGKTMVRVTQEGAVSVTGGSREKQLKALNDALSILRGRQSAAPTASRARQIAAVEGAIAQRPATA
ncbi:MAG: hypothetical protein H6730_01980 [Deltaproteobacteria bacterium]|nr:hypothetical protein [Deltaproteobacteria bacterium]